MLTFVIPVRHPSSIAEPQLAKEWMAQTFASVAAQTHPDWTCVIAAEPDADLPDLPPKFEVVRTDIPAPELPEMHNDKRARRELYRMDKGTRIITALVAAQPTGHVMVVDYDDFISRRLAALCAEHPHANGWYSESGWLYSGGNLVSAYPENFSRLCGTSIIVNSRLLQIPPTMDDVDLEYTGRVLGEHIFIRGDLEEAGTPLEPLPFPGAIYRMGHANSVSVSVSMTSKLFNTSIMRTQTGVVSKLKNLRHLRPPGEIFRGLAQLRPISRSLRQEFFGAV